MTMERDGLEVIIGESLGPMAKEADREFGPQSFDLAGFFRTVGLAMSKVRVQYVDC